MTDRAPADGYRLPDMPESAVDPALVERVATSILNAWNTAYQLNDQAMVQAGESFKRRFYAEIAIRTLIDEEWSSDAEDLAQERESRRVVEMENGQLREALSDVIRIAKQYIRRDANMVIDPMRSLDVEAVKKAEALL